MVTQARGRAPTLEYRVRWEGDAMADTWEPAEYVDACAEALHEYWHQLTVSNAASNRRIAGSNTAVVKGKLQQVRLRAQAAQSLRQPAKVGRRYYQLPAGTTALPSAPTAAFYSKLSDGIRVLIVWPYNEDSDDAYTQWCDGVIVKCTAATAPTVSKRSGAKAADSATHKLSFLDGEKSSPVKLTGDLYSTDVSADAWHWLVYGTEAELQKLR